MAVNAVSFYHTEMLVTNSLVKSFQRKVAKACKDVMDSFAYSFIQSDHSHVKLLIRVYNEGILPLTIQK